MEIKSLGPFGAGGTLSSTREEMAKSVESQSAFVRATPPEASPEATQEEVKAGLLRIADYLHHFKQKKQKKKKAQSLSARKKQTLKALSAYNRVSHFEQNESHKGQKLSLEI
jgi:uncharacterized Rmd1/YagE family protein